ncbi:MAG: hypothetical protein K8H86_15215, partial [Ignavibacteriaceae bacterium]|nr:hypothetical protein [Ignavibacteriaceae bacterium]
MTNPPPVISYFNQSPNPICKGSSGTVYAYLSQGYSVTYTWEAIDFPDGAYIVPNNSTCKVYYPNSSKGSYKARVPQIRLTVTNSVGSDTKSFEIAMNSSCPGCPTLAFSNNSVLVDENPLLITSFANPEVNVTDFYLINGEPVGTEGEYNFVIHEPQSEHTWFDQIQLLEVKVKKNEHVAANEEGEIISFTKRGKPLTITLNNGIDITRYLAEQDSLEINLGAGDVIR